MIAQNENTPDVLKQPMTMTEVDQFTLTTIFLVNVLSDASKVLPAEEFKHLENHAIDRFKTGSLDDQLADYITAKPECFIWDMLPLARGFMKTLAEDARKDIASRENDAATTMVQSTLDEAIANVRGDQARFDRYIYERKASADQKPFSDPPRLEIPLRKKADM